MAAIPGDISTDAQPPMTVPLRHFVVALFLLVLGALVGAAAGTTGSFAATLAHVHLLLAGWVCVTIMGAMTQFVPVWSGTELHSERLAVAELWLVTGGILGFAGSFVGGRPTLLPIFGAVMLLGFWVFVYNLGRTLATVETLDVTERHFALALGFLVLATAFGFLLALDFVVPVFASLPVTHAAVRASHVTLAVFGVVLTTVAGALYQLATMFTQTELHGVDVHLRRFEEVGYPIGVALLALGRLLGVVWLARVGGVLLALGALAVGLVLARRLLETSLEWNPMLTRYAVAAPALVAWAVLALVAWLRDPVGPAALFGAPGTVHLLAFGAIGFVVLGTLYHVVPFIVWVHRYSDRLGHEPVPMIDDLYDDRLARLDLALVAVGAALLVAADAVALPTAAAIAGGAVATVGFLIFAVNLLLVLRDHGTTTLPALLFGTRLGNPGDAGGPAEDP